MKRFSYTLLFSYEIIDDFLFQSNNFREQQAFYNEELRQIQHRNKHSSLNSTCMFPSIKLRIQTESLGQNRRAISNSLFLKSRVRESSIKACIPYIHQLKHSSNRSSPKSMHIKNKKNQKIFTLPQQFDDYNDHLLTYLSKQNHHQQQHPTIASQTNVNKKSPLNQQKSTKIQSLLLQFEKIVNNVDSPAKKQNLPMNPKSKKFKQCMNQYKNLPNNKFTWNQQIIAPFIQSLSRLNPFVRKIKPIVFLCLLRMGKVRIIEENEIIQSQNKQNSTSIGIILWGEVLIKNPNKKMKIYLFSGDSINEQLIFQPNSNNSFVMSQRGQIMKAKTLTAILYLNVSQYGLVYKQLVKVGEKNSISLAQNMMKWSYAKKKNTRTQFSHL